MTERTRTQALVSLKLGQDVVQWATEMRNHQDGTPSYRSIARELHRLTDIDVTDETIRLWITSQPSEQAS